MQNFRDVVKEVGLRETFSNWGLKLMDGSRKFHGKPAISQKR